MNNEGMPKEEVLQSRFSKDENGHWIFEADKYEQWLDELYNQVKSVLRDDSLTPKQKSEALWKIQNSGFEGIVGSLASGFGDQK